MAKGAYIGVNGKARKITGGYVGVDGVARKIKKAYIGIGGVARPCWSGGELSYYGTITPLSQKRSDLAATTVGNYALFGGGYMGITMIDDVYVVNAYNTSLTHSSVTELSVARSGLAATTVGDYALFGGGCEEGFGGTAGEYSNVVDVYDTSLTRSSATELSVARSDLAATTIGDYALFGGGSDGSTIAVVDVYDTSLTRSSATELSVARNNLAATTIGNYALFGGGASGNYSNVVDAYTVQ